MQPTLELGPAAQRARGSMKMTSVEEATCDVECAMKVEEIRILNKKRKQSQKVGGSTGAVTSKGAANYGKAAKRSLLNGSSCGAGPHSAKSGGSSLPPDYLSASAGAAPSLPKTASQGGGTSKDAKDAARRRFVWSVPLHQDFVAAVFDVGLKCASPKLLLEMMPVVDGLTSEHIKSHLQKYRLHRQRSREEFLKSYNYLTDLDGGKSLGGGSAAATVARAAAAAAGGASGGDAKSLLPTAGSDAEPAGCGSSCDCFEASDRSGGGGKADSSSFTGDDDGRRMACMESMGVPPTTSGDGGGAEGIDGSAVKARARPAGCGGTEATAEAQRLQQHMQATAEEVVNGALLLSHLELLAKGIDMQVKFHNHLREVVESQQQLQAQLAERQSREHLVQHSAAGLPAIGTPRAVSTGAGGPAPPSTVDGSPQSEQRQDPSGGVSVTDHNQVPTEVRFVVGGGGGGVSTAGYGTLSGPAGVQAAVVPGNLALSGSGTDKRTGGSIEAVRGLRSASAEERPRRRSRPGVVNYAGGVVQPGAVAAATTDATVDSARVSATPGANRNITDHNPKLRGDGMGELGDAQQQQQLNPSAMREAFSVHAGAAGVSLPQGLLSMGRQGSGVGSRGYVPGEYTLTSKTPEGSAGRETAFMGGVTAEGTRGAHGLIFAARSPAEARATLAAAGLASANPTAVNGQETLTLQRHMQAQMSMQQSMLSACNDQATKFGQRAWCGGGGVASAFGGGDADTPGAGVHRGGGAGEECGGSGGGGRGRGGSGGVEQGAGADVENKEHCLDALPMHPPDAGDTSAMMGLLHQDDMFDFGMLDREGELKPASGDNNSADPAVARPTGGEHSTLFSFLME